jgi:Zn-dependent protease
VPATEQFGAFAVWFVVFLFTLTCHEAGHALAAWLGGDRTAYAGGQVSLNPWPHIRREPFGTIVFPILTFFGSGWMMGWASTPYDPRWAARYPLRQAAMSAAGPAANFLLGAIAFAVMKFLLAGGVFVAPQHATFSGVIEPPEGTPAGSLLVAVAFTLSVALNLNILLGLFNLIPLPPLDGAGVLAGLMPDSLGPILATLSRNPMLTMIGLVVSWRIFDLVYDPAFSLLLRLLHPGVSYS